MYGVRYDHGVFGVSVSHKTTCVLLPVDLLGIDYANALHHIVHVEPIELQKAYK